MEKDVPGPEEVKSLSQQLNINEQLATLLIQRGVTDFEKAKHFFRPSLGTLHDPFLMKDLDIAVNRISEAIAKQEYILVYGDYDVDGTTAVALVYSFLKKYTDNVKYYVPDRYTEGYGLSSKGVEWAAAQNVTLLITLDCGIKAFENAALSKQLGIDLIICDHHRPGENLPEAVAILDPKRDDCQYPYKELSGCGVAFKLLSGFCLQNTIDQKELWEYMDLVAVSIASDIVPITGENRILSFYGLKKLNRDPLPGLKSLIEISALNPPIGVSDVVFYIGPRINAAGRLTHARESVRLLIGNFEDDLDEFTRQLNQINSERRDFDSSITDEALEMIESDDNIRNAKSTVLFKKDWHKGVIGIVASRCTEVYYRPTIILTESNKKATGSARSVNGFDIYEAICECDDLLEQYGGHTHAAGLTLALENVKKFREKFEEVVSRTISEDQLTPKLLIDLKIDFEFIDFKTNSVLSQMAPFGPENLQPTFLTEEVFLKYPIQIIKEEHLKMTLCQKGNTRGIPAIGFGMAGLAEQINMEDPFKIAYHIDENNYLGNKSLQLILKDLKFYD